MRKTRQDIKPVEEDEADEQSIMLKTGRYYGQMQKATKEKAIAKQAVKSVANSGKSDIFIIDAEPGSAKYREIK